MKLNKMVISLLLMFSLCFCLVDVSASSHEIERLDMTITINSDGSARVSETYDMYISQGTEYYKEFTDLGQSSISDLVVKEGETTFTTLDGWDVNASRQEKAQNCGIVDYGDSVELCFGIGDYGNHVFEMSYTITKFVDKYRDAYGAYWNILENMAEYPSDFTLKIYGEGIKSDSRVYGFGYEGTIYTKVDENGIDYVELINTGEIDYVVFLVGLISDNFTEYNTGYVSNNFEEVVQKAIEDSEYYDDYYENLNNNNNDYYPSNNKLRLGFLLPFFTMSFSPVLVVFLILRMMRKSPSSTTTKFQDNQPLGFTMRDVNPFRDIPVNKDIYVFTYLVDKFNVSSERDSQAGVVSAILMKWIRDGIITVVKKEKQGFFKSKDVCEIDFNENRVFDNELETRLYGFFKEASGGNRILEDKEFEKWCKKNYSKLFSWYRNVLSHGEATLRSNNKILTTKEEYRTLLGRTKARYKRSYDSSIREDVSQVMGLKKFLLEFSSINEKEMLEVHLWEEYLMFASILGIADKVEKQIGDIYPEFNEQSNLDIYYTTILTRSFVVGGFNQASSARSAASSSSSGGGWSGGGGGGSSFSGGGGGSHGGGSSGVR